MALTWDVTGCADSSALVTRKRWPYTCALIWYTMFTDIGWEVTTDNAAEFYARIHVMEKLGGTSLNVPVRTPSGRLAKRNGQPYTEPYFITPADVASVIGLKVNVSPLGRSRWAKLKVVSNSNRSSYMDDFTKAYTEGVAS
jgi:hypothetical protein